jgi:hypothetical protein
VMTLWSAAGGCDSGIILSQQQREGALLVAR